MDESSHVISLIESGQIAEASNALAMVMEKEGFNDTVAILAATISSCVGDMDSYISGIESGLSYNPSNYELHLMKAGFLEERDLIKALDEYELAMAYCLHQTGRDSEDFKYIEKKLDEFSRLNRNSIRTYTDKLPILIYKSESVCYGLLNHFADILADEFKKLGETIEIIDAASVLPEEFLPALDGRRFKALIGIQTYLFSVKYKDGRVAHDHIFGPKYNMLFDHPACMYKHFNNGPHDYHILTHDRNYVDYIHRYYPLIKGVYLLPPAGEEAKRDVTKAYSLSFLGTYHDPARWQGEIETLDRAYGGKASLLVDHMMGVPNLTYEDALRQIFGEDVGAATFFDLKQTYFYVMSIYRQRIIKTILDSGLELYVFGDSWKCERWKGYDNLRILPETAPDQSPDIYKSSVASLNIMSWHKDGRTERVSNMMLNNCVVITDKSRYLCESYEDGRDIILFDLDDIDGLPSRIKSLLDNPQRCCDMAGLAYAKAAGQDTWNIRARQFLSLLDEENGQEK